MASSTGSTDGFAVIAGLLSDTNNELVQLSSDAKNLSAKDNGTIAKYQKDLSTVITALLTAPPSIKGAIQNGPPFNETQLTQLDSQITAILQLIKDIVHETIRNANVVKANKDFLIFITKNFAQSATLITVVTSFFVTVSSQPANIATALNEVITTLIEVQIVFGPYRD